VLHEYENRLSSIFAVLMMPAFAQVGQNAQGQQGGFLAAGQEIGDPITIPFLTEAIRGKGTPPARWGITLTGSPKSCRCALGAPPRRGGRRVLIEPLDEAMFQRPRLRFRAR
jgi:hypothetical protein